MYHVRDAIGGINRATGQGSESKRDAIGSVCPYVSILLLRTLSPDDLLRGSCRFGEKLHCMQEKGAGRTCTVSSALASPLSQEID